jgi:hypothetical protein
MYMWEPVCVWCATYVPLKCTVKCTRRACTALVALTGFACLSATMRAEFQPFLPVLKAKSTSGGFLPVDTLKDLQEVIRQQHQTAKAKKARTVTLFLVPRNSSGGQPVAGSGAPGQPKQRNPAEGSKKPAKEKYSKRGDGGQSRQWQSDESDSFSAEPSRQHKGKHGM